MNNLFERIQISIQYLIPQHGLSWLMGKLADSEIVWFKNMLIYIFIKFFPVDMSAAVIENPYDYPSFNAFFIRKLKPDRRPIANGITAAADNIICSPVDGTLSQIGSIKEQQLMQAKGIYYDLDTLLGGDKELSQYFADGLFSTIYLAPHQYHRVHMPISGRLIKTIFIPGDLFSVSARANVWIPQLYTKNERLVCIFETELGQMAIILVGALLVGSIHTVWRDAPHRTTQITQENFTDMPIEIMKGNELGYFKMGSTVIVIFAKDVVSWTLPSFTDVKMGEKIGEAEM